MSQLRTSSVRDLSERADQLLTRLRGATDPMDRELLVEKLGLTIARRGYAASGMRWRRSVAGWIRERHDELPPDLAKEVREAALRAGARLGSDSGRRAMTVAEVADHLRLSEEEVRWHLRSLAGRRALGWPVYIGRGEWRFDPAMVTEARAAYLATLPKEEPPHHLASLPEGYER